jgi:hypothetical protein
MTLQSETRREAPVRAEPDPAYLRPGKVALVLILVVVVRFTEVRAKFPGW